MSSIGPLGLPPTAPIVNPVLWAPELPSNRRQAHFSAESLHAIAPHGIHAHPLPLGVSGGGLGGGGPIETPVDLEERAASVSGMTLKAIGEPEVGLATGVVVPIDAPAVEMAVEAPNAALAAAAAASEGAAPVGNDAAAGEGDDLAASIGDGSLADAERAIEAVRADHGAKECGC